MLRSAAAAAVAAAANFGSRRSSSSASQHRLPLQLQLQLRRRGLASSATAAANTTTCANNDIEATRSFHYSSSDPVRPSNFIHSTSTRFPTTTTAAARRYFGSGGAGGGTDHGDDEDTGTTKAKKGSSSSSSKKKKKLTQRKTGDEDAAVVVDDEEILAVTAATATKKDSSTATDGEEGDDGWEDLEDFFGVDYDDGRDRTGPPDQLPPKYVRDAATGRMLGTERIERELSPEERLVLRADPIERDRVLLHRIAVDWKRKRNQQQQQQQQQPTSSSSSSSTVDDTDTSDDALVDELGERIRTTNLSFNVLGRSVQAQMSREQLDDSEGGTLGITDDGLTLPALTPSEFRAFREYMKRRFHVADITTEDIPVQEIDQKPVEDHPGLDVGDKDDEDGSRPKAVDPDGVDIAMRWITTRGQMEMDDLHDDNPYSDLGPSDLSPTRLVNRRRAKPIPRALLHHNNLDLLRRFLTPTGQIQHRIQTRLGARDQRKVARCVKRARALGLVPYAGQFKVERNGWIHAEDIREERDWERQLVERGLTIRRKNKDE